MWSITEKCKCGRRPTCKFNHYDTQGSFLIDNKLVDPCVTLCVQFWEELSWTEFWNQSINQSGTEKDNLSQKPWNINQADVNETLWGKSNSKSIDFHIYSIVWSNMRNWCNQIMSSQGLSLLFGHQKLRPRATCIQRWISCLSMAPKNGP